MSSVIWLFTVFSLLIPAVRSGEALLGLKCQPSFGIVAQTTFVECEYKNNMDAEIFAVFLYKSTEENSIFEMTSGTTSGDQRFSLENAASGPSLKITDTVLSDEGHYEYRVITDRGEQTVQLVIIVTAKYSDPIISTWPKDVAEGEPAVLYCNATDGYPAGSILWLDNSGADWTPNSELTKSKSLKSVALSSKLSFKSINLSLAPFKCIVLNSKNERDGESTLEITSPSDVSSHEGLEPNTTKIIAGVMVIGSLIVGLLFALLFFRKRNGNKGRRPSAYPFLTGYETGKTAEDDETP